MSSSSSSGKHVIATPSPRDGTSAKELLDEARSDGTCFASSTASSSSSTQATDQMHTEAQKRQERLQKLSAVTIQGNKAAQQLYDDARKRNLANGVYDKDQAESWSAICCGCCGSSSDSEDDDDDSDDDSKPNTGQYRRMSLPKQ